MAAKGHVSLVGAGPGDPGLLTVRGLERIRAADVIVYDRLACKEILDYAKPDAELLYVGKKPCTHTLDQDRINALLVDRAEKGLLVVRLKGGDPFVFGRGGEEAAVLVDAGIPFEVVPGITASVGAAAYAGIPLTHRNIARTVTLITGHCNTDTITDDIDFSALARLQGTLAFYMSVKNLPIICESLTQQGLSADTPAAAIRMGTTAEQEVILGTVASLPQLVCDADLKPPAIVLIGDVVSLREKLDWFDAK